MMFFKTKRGSVSFPQKRKRIGSAVAAIAIASLIATQVIAAAPVLGPSSGVKVNSVQSFAFPFVADKSGFLQRVRVHMDVAQSINPGVLVMLSVYYDRAGTILNAFVEMTQTIQTGVSGSAETVFEAPSGIRLEQGQRYWLMGESPSGNEVLWWGTDQVGQRFWKNLKSGERRYEDGPQAAFTAEIIASP